MAEDREVLEFIGRQGKQPDVMHSRFPDFEMTRLVRAGLAEVQHIELAETQVHSHPSPSSIAWYVLTKRGAEAIGVDPDTLDAA